MNESTKETSEIKIQVVFAVMIFSKTSCGKNANLEMTYTFCSVGRRNLVCIYAYLC